MLPEVLSLVLFASAVVTSDFNCFVHMKTMVECEHFLSLTHTQLFPSSKNMSNEQSDHIFCLPMTFTAFNFADVTADSENVAYTVNIIVFTVETLMIVLFTWAKNIIRFSTICASCGTLINYLLVFKPDPHTHERKKKHRHWHTNRLTNKQILFSILPTVV